MIYMVEIDFDSAEHFADWNAWYNGNLPLIVTVPGVETAQRLEAIAPRAPRYLAIYTITDPDVFESEAYLDIGGGGKASSKWQDFIKRRRNLYAGLENVPEITSRALFGVIDRDPNSLDLPDLLFVPLEAVALAQSPRQRFVTVLNDPSAAAKLGEKAPDLAFYKPLGPRHVSPGRAS